MKKQLIILLALMLCAVLALGACGGGDAGGGTDSGNEEPAANSDAPAEDGDAPAADSGKVEAIKAAGQLVVYTNAEFPPYEYLGAGDEIVGVDIEIAKAIAAKIGVELKVENASFDGLLASLASGKGDLVIAGMTIDDERKEQVDFSEPYDDSIQWLVLPEDSKIAVVEDLKDKIVGSQSGTTGMFTMDDAIADGGVLAGTKTESRPYTSAPIAMEDLKSGRIDAVIIDEQVAMQLSNQNDGYKAIPLNYKSGDPVEESYGVAIPKGNPDLVAVVNEVIAELKAGDQINKWLVELSIADE